LGRGRRGKITVFGENFKVNTLGICEQLQKKNDVDSWESSSEKLSESILSGPEPEYLGNSIFGSFCFFSVVRKFRVKQL
jgi:hypothetical protein